MWFMRSTLLYTLTIIIIITIYPIIVCLILYDHLSVNALAQVTQQQDIPVVKNNQANTKLDNSKSDTALVCAQIAAATTIVAATLTGFLTLINQRKIASLDIQKKNAIKNTW